MDADGPGGRARARRLLVAGVVLGIVLAAAGTVTQVGRPGRLPPGAVASVNGVPIPVDLYERTLAGLAADKRNPLRDEDRAHVLERLVDEELLVQRGAEVGLLESEPRVRKVVVAEMIQAILSDAESDEPSPAELRAFFEENRGYFTTAPRLRVERLLFRGADAAERAREARARLAADPEGHGAAAALADPAVVRVPDAALPSSKLREYLGPTLTEAAEALPVGAWSEPLPAPDGVALLRVKARQDAAAPAFETVLDQVRAEYRRRAGDRALRAYLAQLRHQADITTLGTVQLREEGGHSLPQERTRGVPEVNEVGPSPK